MRFLVTLFALVGLAAGAPALAHAAEPAPPSAASCPLNEDGIPECPKPVLELGARTGVALPFGSVASGSQLSDSIDAQIPVQIDLGFRPDPHLFIGAYGSYGFLLPASGVCQGGSCSGSDVRAGLEAQFHFRPGRRFDPWLGVGTGYEWLHLASWSPGKVQDGIDTSTDANLTLRGWEIVNAQAGLDYALCTGVRVGPFVGFSIGEFENASQSYTVRGIEHASSTDIQQTALHEWLTLGLRGSFDL
jgi:hypothetical protein